MQFDALRDLVMAGVVWELADPVADAMANAPVNSDAQRVSGLVPPIAPTQPISPDVAASAAARPTDISALIRMIAEFNHPLRPHATNVVLPHIAQNPNGLMIITDIPGSEDDASGTILSGPTGELTDKMLNAIGMDRTMVSITPMIFWRTPGGRTPTDDEVNLSRPFVMRIIEMIRPRIILTFGTLPAAQIANANLARAHGVPVHLDCGADCYPVFHPNYLILKPGAKRDVWNVLQTVQNLLKTA